VASSSIGRSSAILASGTVVSRVLGFAKAWLLLQAIGSIGFGADAYATSTIVPNSIYAIVAQGILNAVLVPQIVRASSHPDGGRAYINKLTTVGIVLFAVLAAVATILAGPLMHLFGVDPKAEALATAFAYWSLPQIFFLGLYTLLGEALNARKSFGPFTWAPVLNNIVAIVLLVVFISAFHADPAGQRPVDSWTPSMVALLAGGATLGMAAQAIILFFFWRKVGLKFRLDFRWRGVNLGYAGRAAAWTFAMLICQQIAGLIQTNVSNSASGHNASTQVLSTAWLIFMLPHSIIAVSIVTAYYTRMSEHAHKEDIVSFRADFSAALRTISMLIVFSAAALIVVAYPFARIFTPHYTEMGNVLIAYLIGLLPYTILFMTQRAFYAISDTVTPFLFTLAQVAIVIGGSLSCLALPSSIRAIGIATTVSVATIVQTFIGVQLLRRRIGGIDGRRSLASIWRFLLAGALSAVVGVAVLIGLGGTYRGGFAVSGLIPAFVSIVIVGLVMFGMYFTVLALLRSQEFMGTLRPVVARLRALVGR
jgi:putative peptidoglycan lipid II flippase